MKTFFKKLLKKVLTLYLSCGTMYIETRDNRKGGIKKNIKKKLKVLDKCTKIW